MFDCRNSKSCMTKSNNKYEKETKNDKKNSKHI